jgi:hypothetical protein
MRTGPRRAANAAPTRPSTRFPIHSPTCAASFASESNRWSGAAFFSKYQCRSANASNCHSPASNST